MRITGGKIVVTAGIAVLAVATWFASKTPVPPPLPAGATATSSPSDIGDLASSSAVRERATSSVGMQAAITITNPAAGDQWVIGEQHTISWNIPGGMTGEIALVNATSGVVAGWIQQTIAPTQTSYPWNTEYLFAGAKIPSTQQPVLPGEYVIKIYFARPNMPTVVSPAFFLSR